MVGRARALVLLAAVTPVLVGGDCGGGDGGGGSPATVTVSSPDPLCSALAEKFPPGFDFVPGIPGRVLVANFSPSGLVPLEVETAPFQVPAGARSFVIPPDSDGDGSPFEPPALIDDVFGVGPDLVLATASLYEEVIFIDPDGALRSLAVEVPAGFDDRAFRFLPPPGSGPVERTAVSTQMCLEAPPGALDSRGQLVSAVAEPGPFCRSGSYPARFTSGLAVSGGHLFVSTSNLGEGEGSEDTQYLPGAVLVYDLDPSGAVPLVRPNADTPVLFTTAFNPTHVTAVRSPGGRDFVLVSGTGAIGLAPDDPTTTELEAGVRRLTDGAIDVIDVARLAHAATIPLVGANPSFDALAIDPSGRVALTGDVAARRVVGVDLASLDALPQPPDPAAAAPIVLDGSSAGFDDAVIFDGRSPLVLPARVDGAPASSCPGRVEGVAFDHSGARAYAIESCDGTLTTLSVDLSGDPSTRDLRARIAVESQRAITGPIASDRLGEPAQPASLKVRPGEPGVDYSGPDVFYTVGEPDGLLCGLRVESLGRARRVRPSDWLEQVEDARAKARAQAAVTRGRTR